MKISILQWNILFSEDIRKVRDFIKTVDPDICCLQELTMDSPDYNDGVDTTNFLAQGLGMSAFYVPAQKYPDAGSLGNAILSKVEPSFTRSAYLQNPVVVDPTPETEGRVYLEALIEYSKERSLSLATTHLAYVPRFEELPWKRQEWNHLHNEVDEQKNFVFTGDLNALPDGTLITELSQKLKHAGPDTSENTWTTKPFDLLGFKADKLEYRLDYAFTSEDVNVLSCKILNTDVSDHLPLLLEIEI